jgi:chromosome segregation protein
VPSSSGASPLFLKSIDIAGFKSFARPVRLELPPGITALVGPNGSGKSNVVDALRWAMGEQNIRELRGQRSEDIIHAGPRRSLGLAEVVLTLDMASREDGPPEVGVARRLYRSGESEYLVQGRKGRLRDLQDALRGLGVPGADTVVVNQGMADALLTATPLERRLVLEQAAGLAGYRARREEARHKLQATAHNLQTIEVVLAELEPRLRVLRRQARAVTEREEARARLATALTSWYAVRWAEARARLEDVSARCAEEEQIRRKLIDELRALEEAAEGAIAAEREWRRRLDIAQSAVFSTQRELDAARFAERTAEQHLSAAERALAEAGARGAELESLLAEARARNEEAEQAGAALGRERAAIDEQIDALRHALGSREGRLAALQAKAAAAQAAYESVERDLTAVIFARQALQETLRREQERLDELAPALERLQNARIRLVDEQAQREQMLAAGRNAADSAARQAENARGFFERAKAAHDRAQRVQRRLHMRHAAVCRRRAAAERDVASLTSQVSAPMLVDLAVPEGKETAISAALGDWPRGAPDTPPAARDLESFLSWRRGLERLIDGAVWADTVLDSAALGDLNPLHAALLVEDDDSARRLWTRLAGQPAHRIGSPPVRVITRRGEVIAASGVSGSGSTDVNARFLLARREHEVLTRRETRLQSWLERVQAGLQAAQENVTVSDLEVHERERALRAAEQQVAATERAATKGEREVSALTVQLEGIEHERFRLIESTAAAQRDLEAHQEHELNLSARREACSRSAAAARSAVEEERERMEAAQREIRELIQRRDLLATQQASDARALAALAEHVQRLERERAALAASAERHGADRERWIETEAQERERVEELAAVLAEQQRALAETHAAQPELAVDREPLETARRRLSEKVREHERARAQLAQCEEERDRLRIEIVRELQRAPELLGEPPCDPPTEDEVRRLRLRATQYPEADMTVVEECKELEERYLRLRSQLEDLSDAGRELDAVIEIADREMRTRFNDAFSALNGEFSRVFEVMLRGGDAALELTEDGGVGVRARLPGKRTRSSASFSGGERALVASSLLFGMLRLRPTPFVVLDEVDAALDESNVDRYVAALRDISVRTQVIIVTHNRATMEAADVLYGVTMDDEGVSHLLSLRLDAYAAAG